MSLPVILSLCDYTAIMVQPWADAGYPCICVDLQHPRGESTHGNITRIGANLLHWIPPALNYHAAFAFPMCTVFAVSGARWFKDKGLRALIDGLELVERSRQICEWTGERWAIENPVGTLSTYWRKPDYIFNPNEYGGYLTPPADAYTKKTCIWAGKDFVMPEKRPVDPIEGSRMHLFPPSPDRANLRSATPAGFSRAVFEANLAEQERVR